MTKGDDTRLSILEIGLDMASRLGLEAVTIGDLARTTRMSKSGLFAHFHSKENLQIELLKYAGEMFSRNVVVPVVKTKAGIPRIKAVMDNWIRFSGALTGGCIFVTASSDFKDRPGKVRDYLLKQQSDWIDSLRRIAQSAIKVGDFRSDTDCDQFAFEFYSLLLGFHLYATLLDKADIQTRQAAAFETLINNYRAGTKNPIVKSS